MSELGGRTAPVSGKSPKCPLVHSFHFHWVSSGLISLSIWLTQLGVTAHYAFIFSVFVPRIVFCSRTLWQEDRLLMPVGRTETFWGCGTISVTTKPPRSVISRTALWKLYIHLRKKNNNFLKILNQHHSGLNNDLHWRCSLWKCHNLSPFRKSRCTAVFICTELNSTSLAMWQQSRIWTWTLAPFSLSPEPKHLGNAPPSGS